MKAILVHFEKSALGQLDAVCRRTLVPRAAFIRRAVDNAQDPNTGIEAQIILDAELAATEADNKLIAAAQKKAE
jgi:hypothetical protein